MPLQMMTRGFCQAQLDKLHQIPEYLEIIEDDGVPLPIQPQQGKSQEEGPSKEQEEPSSKRTRSTTGKKSVLPQKTRTKVKSGFKPTQLKHLEGVGSSRLNPTI